METTTYIALSRQMVLRRRMDVIANNIANMTASGFRAEALLAEQVPVDVGSRQTIKRDNANRPVRLAPSTA